MNYSYDLITTVQQLYQYVVTQQKRIEQLELRVATLEENFTAFKNDNTGKVERIEYKFDQLKVERLEGTLNIGITPTGGIQPGAIEDFTVHRSDMDVPSTGTAFHSVLFENVKKSIYHYLNRDCYDVMTAIEQQHNYHLDVPYRNFIIDDIRKQIDSRIQYYLQGINIVETNEETLKELEETTINNVKNDINRTIEQFITHLPQKGE